VRAVPSLITPCSGDDFQCAQKQRPVLTFAQRSVVTLWDLLDRRAGVVGAQRASSEDAV